MYHSKIEPNKTPISFLRDGALTIGVNYDATMNTFNAEWMAGSLLSKDQEIEVWLYTTSSRTPISLCVLSEKNSASVKVSDKTKKELPMGIIAISSEQAGGAPMGMPTGNILAVGSI